MSYPYAELQTHLQLKTSPELYQSMLAPYRSEDGVVLTTKLDDRYWSTVPRYVYARCPICHSKAQSPIDTYSLAAWGSTWTQLAKTPFPSSEFCRADASGCEHVVGVQSFINLHDQRPDGCQYFYNEAGEVPLITPWCIQPDLRSFAVLHALPICTVQQGEFVPSFTVFCLSYFSNAPAETMQRHCSAEWQLGLNEATFFPKELSKPSAFRSAKLKYDLAHWAKAGYLGYLDYKQPDLPLVIGSGTQLPSIYQNIRGLKRGYTWRNGQQLLHQKF